MIKDAKVKSHMKETFLSNLSVSEQLLSNVAEKSKDHNIQLHKRLLKEIKCVTHRSSHQSQEKQKIEMGLFRKNLCGVASIG